MKKYSAIIIGGGAAGIFASIICAENKSNVLVLEQTQKLLSKVKISGGGRCNVTHSCFDPKELVKNYPRGNKELLGPFTRFQPRDVVTWFEKRGVALKTEEDGRMFPVTDDSQTIIDCLLNEAAKLGVEIRCGAKVKEVQKKEGHFVIKLANEEELQSEQIMLATGSSKNGHELAVSLGHSIVEPVPSLFTFNIPDSPMHELSGISAEEAEVYLPEFGARQKGPLLITHWGFSGPAVLKLSAWCARALYEVSYETTCLIDWIPKIAESKLQKINSNKTVVSDPQYQLPKNLWKKLVELSGIDENCRWGGLSKVKWDRLVNRLKHDTYQISGKTTYKQEFVTCGGVKLSEVDFKTMESKLCPGLYFGGEILDIDGVTGGFNFQAAWTTGWLAGTALGVKKLFIMA